MNCKLAVDTGGTFTDVTVVEPEGGTLYVVKVPSTSDDPSRAVLEGVRAAAEEAGVEPERIRFLIHGTTVATNALLEHKGAATALVTTRGFRDVLEIARQTRPRLYDLHARRPPPLVPRRLRFEVTERVAYTGEVLCELDAEDVADVSRRIGEAGVESVAVCLLHAYANPAHEQAVRQRLARDHPGLFLSVSSEVLPEFREYERTSTVAINAFVMPRVNGYVARLRRGLRDMGLASDLYIMQSSGGVITAEMAREASARTVLSGPAGGALAGAHLCERTGTDHLVSVDMGGTSLDICLLEHRKPRATTESRIGGYPIKLPMIDMHTIGAGGGSIAWIDAGGALRVGPHSAGAQPGPACYGRGGTAPTVTDAHVVLGRIHPTRLLGGRMRLDRGAAREAVRRGVAGPLGWSVEEAAAGILRVVNANMVRGIRVVSVENGYDPREFALGAFGGAGPLHAAELARELSMPKVIVPPYPGVTSALGMLTADVRHDFVQTRVAPVRAIGPDALTSLFERLEQEALQRLAEEGFEEDARVLERNADLRYAGQAFELPVETPPGSLSEEDLRGLEAGFHAAHRRRYGYERRGEPVELVNVRLVALGRLPPLPAAPPADAVERDADPGGHRSVYLDGAWVETGVHTRERLVPGHRIRGPAIVEQLDTTTLVLPGQEARVDAGGNIVIRLAGSGRT